METIGQGISGHGCAHARLLVRDSWVGMLTGAGLVIVLAGCSTVRVGTGGLSVTERGPYRAHDLSGNLTDARRGGPRAAQDNPSGEELYRTSCAACHGADGRGAPPSLVGFDIPLPDFSSCTFASREPDADWVAIAHEGGPVRGFDTMMPAFGDALTVEQLERVVAYIRGFCGDDAWPRGELNLPRPFFTEKAYPEDEAVLTTTSAVEGPAEFTGKVTYEKRFGARNQLELSIPFAVYRIDATTGTAANWDAGLGDVGVGWKRDVFHSSASGTIVSLAGEVVLPTGDESDGFGKGFVVFEPFVSLGQILPGDGFFHVQAGVELPTEGGEQEAFWRAVVGKTVTQGSWGRAWSPMIEILGATELDTGDTVWDVVPQVQITLNTRQHVMANIGVRVPVTESGSRSTQLLMYLLWDFFDGGLLEGW